MQITAILTAEATTLMIEASEVVNLEQMGHEADPARLANGARDRPVSAGVFKVVSKQPIKVTSKSSTTYIAQRTIGIIANDKDGPFPDQTMVKTLGFDVDAVKRFFADAKPEPAPR